MCFKVGDIIIGKPNNGYSLTNQNSLMLVVDMYDEYVMEVAILCSTINLDCIKHTYDVDNSEEKFSYTTIDAYVRRFPSCYKISQERLSFLCSRFSITEIKIEEEEEEETNPYVLSDEMRKELLEEMKTLLVKYHYHPTDMALNRILDEWCRNKADLIRLFEKHPNYNGKFQIVFDCDFDRNIDKNTIYNFRRWLGSSEVRNAILEEVKIGVYSYGELRQICNKLYQYYRMFLDVPGINTINGKTRDEYAVEYTRFTRLKDRYESDYTIYCQTNGAYKRESQDAYEKTDYIDSLLYHDDFLYQFVNEEASDYLNNYFPDAKIKVGQKMSRVVNKLLCMLGANKAPNYNKEFAKFADAINPLKIKRHTVISIHPVDYYTMSFGNSWSSCHTIDKENERCIDGEHNYRGCSSSGTESYMLDGTSCVFYTVKSEYDGDTLELEDKINRCMFHYYDNRLLQGRVYPQSNDSGGNNLYKDIREIAQKVFADMLKVPNYWTNKAGVHACCDATSSYGTHYRDYESYGTCNVSTLKDDREFHNYIQIGHLPICPHCGEEHYRENSIECRDHSY